MTKAARLRARSSPRPTRTTGTRAAWVVVAHAAPSPSIRDFQHDLAAFVGGTSEHLVCHLCLIERQNRADPCFQRAAFEQVGDLRQPLDGGAVIWLHPAARIYHYFSGPTGVTGMMNG